MHLLDQSALEIWRNTRQIQHFKMKAVSTTSFGFALNLHGENWDQPFEYQRDDKSLACKMCQVQPLDSDEKTAAAAEPHTTLPLCTL